MTTSNKSRPLLAHKGLLVPLGLVVLLTLLYVAGVPWVVVALDGFWEAVDRLAQQPRLMSFLTALSWAVAAVFVHRFYRLYLWNKRVAYALEAVTDLSPDKRKLGWGSLSRLAASNVLHEDERAWLSAVLDDLHEHGGPQPSTSPTCERCGRS